MLPQKTFGLVIPFTLQAKLLIRQLWAEKVRKLRWNDNIISNLKPERLTFFQALFGTQSTTFKRDPISVVFSDGSQEAFGTCVYAGWRQSNEKYESHVVAAKRRIAPVKKISVVRWELNGVLLRTRISNFIKEESRLKFEKKLFMVNSHTVKAMLQKELYGFNTFSAVQIGETQSTTGPKDWLGIKGEINVADWITRRRKPTDTGIYSKWQRGLKYLQMTEA